MWIISFKFKTQLKYGLYAPMALPQCTCFSCIMILQTTGLSRVKVYQRILSVMLIFNCINSRGANKYSIGTFFTEHCDRADSLFFVSSSPSFMLKIIAGSGRCTRKRPSGFPNYSIHLVGRKRCN